MNRLPYIPYPLKKLTCALATISIIPTLWAAPEQGQIIGGQGSIDQQGKNTLIQQASDRLSINWQNFDIKSDERVQFIQPGESSIAFNRILSNKGSLIQGRIDANGQVVLINPNGIIFTETASVNVGALVASGLDINNEEFLNGEFTLNALEGTGGQVINSGLLNAAAGGSINLLGQQVENKGLISANLGHVNLAAGKEAVLTFERDGLIGVRVTEAVLQEELGVHAAVSNSGNISAQGGKVLITGSVSKNIFSQAVNVGELSQAKSAVVNQDGSFTLGAGADVVNSGTIEVGAGAAVILGENITHSGRISADNSAGDAGAIELNAAKTTLNQGTSQLTAKADKQGRGGDIKILGQQVGLLDEAQVDASGAEGGGHILIGGDKTGANSLINNADYSFIDEHAQVSTNGLGNGDGGKLIVFAEDSARIYGDLSARGGTNGDGGFVETSGLRGLEVSNSPDISAPGGKAGHWLIDPFNIEIVNSISLQPAKIRSSNTITNSIVTKSIFTSLNDTAQIGWNSIRNVLDNGTGGTVEIKTSGGAGTGGTIKVAADFDFASLRASDPQNGFNSTLILRADKNIEFADSVTYLRASANNRLNMQFNAQSGINFNRAALSTNGGNLNATTQNGSIASTGTLSTTRSGETLNNSGRLQFTAANGSILLNSLSTAGNQVSATSGRGGNAGTIVLDAVKGAINISGALDNKAGAHASDPLRHGNGAPLVFRAEEITTQGISTSANTSSFTVSKWANLGEFNSNFDCNLNCAGNLSIVSATDSSGINVNQSASWNVKGNTFINGGAKGSVTLDKSLNRFTQLGKNNSLQLSADTIDVFSRYEFLLGDISAGSLTLGSYSPISQVAGAKIIVEGAASIFGTQLDIKEPTNDFKGTLNIRSDERSATIADANTLRMGNINSIQLTLDTQGEVQLAGPLSSQTRTATITQRGPGAVSIMDSFSSDGMMVNLSSAITSGRLNYRGSASSAWSMAEGQQGLLNIANKTQINFNNFSSLHAVSGGQLIGPNTNTSWQITGLNKGALSAVGFKTMEFSGMSTLIGGNQRDQFDLAGGITTGRINGGAGIDTFGHEGRYGGGSWYLNADDNNVWKTHLGDQNFSAMESLYGFEAMLHGPEGDNTWRMTSLNSGMLNDRWSFRGFTQLLGSSGNDRYLIGPGRVAHDGIIDFGGVNELISDDPNSIWTMDGPGHGNVSIAISDSQNYPIRFRGMSALTGSNNMIIAPIRAGETEVNTWVIDGVNSGALNTSTRFSGMSTLKGSGGRDEFEIRGSGYITDRIIGGDGSDSIISTFNVGDDWTINSDDNNWLDLFSRNKQFFSQIENITSFSDGLLRGPQGDNTWRITGTNAGTLNNKINFRRMFFLHGNTGNDNYTLDGGFIAYGISDFGGTNTLTAALPRTGGTRSWIIDNQWGNSVSVDFGDRSYAMRFSGIYNLAGSNSDILTGPDNENAWYINGVNSGTLNNSFTFSGMSSLQGNNQVDRFTLSPAGVIRDGITGAEGQDSMRVDAVTGTSWSVLSSNQALVTTGYGAISQAFSDIEVLQGDGNSSLTGPQSNNNWRITAINAGTLNNTFSFSGMNLLRGNTGDDNFEVSGFVTSEGVIGAGGFDTITALGGPTQWTLSGTGSGWLRYLDIANYVLYFSGIEAVESN